MTEPPSTKRRSESKASRDNQALFSIATIAFYVVALAFLSFACFWFFCVRPPRSPEEFLLLWLFLFLGGMLVYHLSTKND